MDNNLNQELENVNTCNTILTDNELGICVVCRHELPLTNYHYERPETEGLRQV